MKRQLKINQLMDKYHQSKDKKYLKEIKRAHKNEIKTLSEEDLLEFVFERVDISKEIEKHVRDNNYDVSDELLFFSYKRGDELAGELLKEKYINIVRTETQKLIFKGYYALGYDEEDLFQEAYIGFLNSLNNYKVHLRNPLRTFTSFVVKRTLELVISRTRSDKQKSLNSSSSYDVKVNDDSDMTFKDFLSVDESYTPEVRVVKRDRLKEIWDTLSPFEKSVLLYYSEGMSYRDMGDLLLKNVKCYKKRVKSIDNAVQRINKKRDEILEEFKSGGI